MKDKVFAYGFVAMAAVLLLLAVYKTFFSVNKIQLDKGQVQQQAAPSPVFVPPTLSPQERVIIAKIETLTVDITDTAITPLSVAVKQYDQVAFYNKTKGKTITVDGGDWGKVPLAAGENMTQAFRILGTFKYQVAALGLSGEVVVK